MRVGVVGSRGFPYKTMVVDYMVWDFRDSDICVSGGCKVGVDAWVKALAAREGYTYEEIPADWDKYGKGAGFIRNSTLVDQIDRLVAFWDGKSRGTQDTIIKALEDGLPVEIHYPNGVVDHASLGYDRLRSTRCLTTSQTFVEEGRSRPEASPRRTRRSSEPGP